MPRAASSPRVGSVSGHIATDQEVRKLPEHPRTHALESALSDLLSSEGDASIEDDASIETDEVAIVEDTSPTVESPESRAQEGSARHGTVDLYEALLEEDGSAPRAEVSRPNGTKATEAADDTAATREASVPVEKEPSTGEQIARLPKPHPAIEPPQAIVEENRSDPFEAPAEKAFTANSMRTEQSPATIEPSAPAKPIENEPAGNDLLLSYQQPVIVSHVEGPRRILVGREASYQITLENISDTKAENLSAAIRVPEWADIVDAMSSGGVVERGGAGLDEDVLNWQLDELAAKSSATLRLRLIPRSGRPLQLGIQWSQAPVSSEAIVEVQEPKLQIDLGGPQEVLFGKSQRYRLTLSNPGTGVAEKVVVQLIPPGGDAESATSQPIGSLQPGEVKEIELELTAREAGELLMQASAVADGGLSAEVIKKVLCRKPELQVDWRGPDSKYSGTVSAYYLRVQNPGTATTEPVTVTFKLPEGAKFVTASDGHTLDTASGTVSWRLAGLGVNEEVFMQVRCRMDRPGMNRFDVTAQTKNGELSDTKTIQTQIIALADLKLEVSDPQGPLPLGEPALYEIRVRNRGTTAAKGVTVVGLFSAGIDPVSIEGAQYTERDGRVTFHPIKSLPAGREIVLRIQAQASQAGTHIFRAEVACQDLDIKLAAEEATRFFKDEFRWEDGRTPYSAENTKTIKR